MVRQVLKHSIRFHSNYMSENILFNERTYFGFLPCTN